ncbi:MAG TPA: nucleotidyltransferase family protein [Pyrinomonadaceae bacterium]|nr:nucleotidyltransferase family protein [Pyrinomonadaceae bacterium]
MRRPVVSSRGSLVATTLEGSWRISPSSELNLSATQLDEVTPLLYDSGAAGLGWWRIRETNLRDTPSGELLHQAFRLLTLQANIQQTKVQKIFRLMRAAGVEPILLKGWAIARLFPQPALRPYGDIDLFVRPQDCGIAKRVIESEAARGCWVDLHAGISELADSSAEELFARSKLVWCGEVQVRVPGGEDHFALLAIHLLKHGAWRPTWLCDLGLLLESMPNDFDWDLCLGKNKRRANWILSAIGLAHELVGAEISNEQIDARAREIPAWLARSVLKEWETPFAIDQPPMSHRAPMRSYLRHPRGLLSDLAHRWPNPILATVSVKGKFNRWPRLPYQLGNCLVRAGEFIFPRLKRA